MTVDLDGIDYSREETTSNCDHFMQLVDSNGNCVRCGKKINMTAMALRMKLYCEEKIKEDEDLKKNWRC